MKKTLLSLASFISAMTISFSSQAQMANGSTAPNFTGTDLDGNTHTLQDYLSAGKYVFVDVSATWCGPCWSYHNTHALRDLYNEKGPNGTDEVMVFFIEGDNSTGLADLQGNTNGTQGDWISNTPYPIIDDASIGNQLQITYFPTVYMICPSGKIMETGSVSKEQLIDYMEYCPAYSQSFIDPMIEDFLGAETHCGDNELIVDLWNTGYNDLTSLTINTVNSNGEVVHSYDWTGTLTTLQNETVNMGSVSLDYSDTFTFEFSSDQDLSRTVSTNMSLANAASTEAIQIKIYTDTYPEETSWQLKSSTGAILANGGPYNGQANTTIVENVTVTAGGDCTELILKDSYGDGINNGVVYHDPAAEVLSNGVQIAKLTGNIGSEKSTKFFSAFATSTENLVNAETTLSVYPNPFAQNATIELDLQSASTVTTKVVDVLGKVVFQETSNYSAGKNRISLDGTDLNNGVYYVNVNIDGQTLTQRVILNK